MFEPSTRKQVCGELVAIAKSMKPKVVVNRARNAYEAQIACNILSKYARQELMIHPENLGFVFFDKCVTETINCGTPFVVSHPRSKIAGCIADISNRLGYV